jgi:hypothetical protein
MALGDLRDNIMTTLQDANVINQYLAKTAEPVQHPQNLLYKDGLIDISATLDVSVELKNKQNIEAIKLIDDMQTDFDKCILSLGLQNYRDSHRKDMKHGGDIYLNI